MKEKTKYIPALLSLTAALITCIVTILSKYTALEIMVTILVVLIIFYIAGLIIKFVFEKNFIIEETEEELTEGEETEDSETENASEAEKSEE